jgi:Cof subfamily protein (haloacid dehalogenase superfamily)
MRIKVLAVDLDGTLLDVGGKPHEEDRRALAAARQAGLATSIVTGRLFSGTRPTAHACGVEGPVACVDGAHIVHAGTGEDLRHTPLRRDHADALRAVLREHTGVATFVFAHDQVIHDDVGEPYLEYVKTWSRATVHHPRVTEHGHWEHPRGLSQVACVGPAVDIHAAADRIQDVAGDQTLVVRFPMRGDAHAWWAMLVRSLACTKGTALAFLAAHHGCLLEEVAVVGDWINDVPMFEKAGRSFAMGQAPAAVKAAATDVLTATHVTGGGVAEALRRLGVAV